jgi:KaiC/GvpD/RAD55 family RecA-like ATPase
MPTYDIKVIVEYFFEVEADNAEQAEELGWHYEDYAFSGEVYSIDVDEQPEEEEVELDEEVI